MKKGKFIVLEGPEGVGKSTQIQILSDAFDKVGIKHIVTKEPGGSPTCSKIRYILLDPAGKVVPIAELLLYLADRVQHLEEVVKPTLKAGIHVLCDRYKFSTEAYQAVARGLRREYYWLMSVIDIVEPDIAILLDCPIDECLPRAKARGDDTRFELEGVGFHKKVRKGFLERFNSFTDKKSGRLKIVDVSGRGIEDIHQEILGLVLEPFKEEQRIEEQERKGREERARIFGNIVARVEDL